jgi:hypothetical protein
MPLVLPRKTTGGPLDRNVREIGAPVAGWPLFAFASCLETSYRHLSFITSSQGGLAVTSREVTTSFLLSPPRTASCRDPVGALDAPFARKAYAIMAAKYTDEMHHSAKEEPGAIWRASFLSA